MLTYALSLASSSQKPAEGLPVLQVGPTLLGNAAIGQILTLTPGVWSNAPTLTFQWYRDGVMLAGETHSSYGVIAADAGTLISAIITAENAAGAVLAGASGLAVPPAAPPAPWEFDFPGSGGLVIIRSPQAAALPAVSVLGEVVTIG